MQHPSLTECRTNGPQSGAELFIVEGASARAAVVAMRDPSYQAVFAMQGKPLNPQRASRAKILAYPPYRDLTEAIGSGLNPDFRLAEMRYDRILLLMDPDADGIHCALLLTMFFLRWMKPLLEEGWIEMIHAPVGVIYGPEGGEIHVSHTERDFQKRVQELAGSTNFARRHRGLAGMDAPLLRRTCLRRSDRKTSVLSVKDVELSTSYLYGPKKFKE